MEKNDIHDLCSICEPKHCQNILVTQIYQVHVYIQDHLHIYKETCKNKQALHMFQETRGNKQCFKCFQQMFQL